LLHYLLAKKPTFNYIRPLLLNILFENYSYPSCIKNAKTMLSLPSVLKNKYVAAKIKLIQAQCYLKTYNADKALILLKECENFYKKTNKKLLLIKSLVLKAKVLTRLKKYADSIKTADTISSILKADYPKIISLLTKARTMFYMKEKVKEAEANFEKAFTFFKEAKSEYHLIRTGVDLAAVKIRLKKYSEANKIIASTEKLLKNKKTPLDLLAALSFSKAFILFNAQKYALALEHFLIAVSYSLKTGNSRIYGKSRFYAGVCLLRGKKYKEALKEFFSVIKVARKKGFININGWALFYLHYSYYMLKDHKKSLAYLEGAIEVLGDINHESLSYLRKRYKLLKNKKKLPEVFEKPVKRRERALNSTAAR
jgi:tetratricopeptide (TPR) repeat protein